MINFMVCDELSFFFKLIRYSHYIRFYIILFLNFSVYFAEQFPRLITNVRMDARGSTYDKRIILDRTCLLPMFW